MFVFGNSVEVNHALIQAPQVVEELTSAASVYRGPGLDGEQVSFAHIDRAVLLAAEDRLDLMRKAEALRAERRSSHVNLQLARITALGAAHTEFILDAPAPGLLLDKNVF